MITLHAPVLTTPCESSSHGSYPSDKEIALLAFEHWKLEGCSHLRPEHWLTAEKELMEAYAAQGGFLAPADSDRLEEFWEKETETISGFAHGNEFNLATKDWS